MIKGKYGTLLVETRDPSICADQMKDIQKRNKNILAVHATQPVEYHGNDSGIKVVVDKSDFVLDVRYKSVGDLEELKRQIKKELKSELISVRAYP